MKLHSLTAAAFFMLAIAASSTSVQANNFGMFMGFGRPIAPVLCLTDYQVRQRVAAEGFTNIFLNAPIDRHIQVRATKGKWVYLIDYNRCRGEIVSAKRLRRAS
ncbi:hypothetical protein XM25_08090 [Devosia sp. H5989]|nr:hypothetical protein XM25_08090 [Devosia sp. H5989]